MPVLVDSGVGVDVVYPGSSLSTPGSVDQLQQSNHRPVPLMRHKVPGPGAYTPHGGQLAGQHNSYIAAKNKPPEFSHYHSDRNFEFATDDSPGPCYSPSTVKGENKHAVFSQNDRFRRGGPRAREGGEAAFTHTSRVTPGVGTYESTSVDQYKYSREGVGDPKFSSKIGTFAQSPRRHHVADSKQNLMMSAQPFISETHMRENIGLHSPGPAAYGRVEEADRSVRARQPEFSFSHTEREAGSETALRLAANVSPGPTYNTCSRSTTKVGCTLSGSQAPAFGFGTAPRLTKIWDEMDTRGTPMKNEMAKRRFILSKQQQEPSGVWSPGPIYFPASSLGPAVGICGSSRWT